MSFVRSLGVACLLLGIVDTAHAETLLERGAYLVRSIAACGNCHTPKGEKGEEPAGMELAGGLVIDEKPFTAVMPNITPDRETGIGGWTDAEILRAIREGVRPDGSIIGPPMPVEFYRGISDRDGAAIVAYLRSLPPVRNQVAKSVYRMPLPPSWGPPVGKVEAPATSYMAAADKVAYGAYLAGPLGHCLECHTPRLPDGRRDMSARAGAGGMPINGPAGPVVPPNLTPDRATGLGAWTDAEIRRAITQGVHRDGRSLMPPMAFAYYARMSDGDLDAIIAYLRALKPIRKDP